VIFNKANLTAKLKREGIFYTPIETFKQVFARMTHFGYSGCYSSKARALFVLICAVFGTWLTN